MFPVPTTPQIDPIAQLFAEGRAGAFWYPHPSRCWQNEARTTPAAIGDPVRVVDAMYGTYGPAVAPSDAERPILRQDANGRFYLDGDGVDDRLNFGPSLMGVGYYAAHAFRLNTLNGNTGAADTFGVSALSWSHFIGWRGSNGFVRRYSAVARAGGTPYSAPFTDTDFDQGVAYLGEGGHDTATNTVFKRINGNYTETTGADLLGATLSSDGFIALNDCQADIFGALYVEGAVPAAQQAAIRAYLQSFLAVN